MHDPPRILIVDDNETNRCLLTARLGAEGYETTEAENGERALAVAHEVAPDVVLLDVMMPKIDGFEVCRRMKGDPTLGFVPIVMVTARTDSKDVVTGLNAELSLKVGDGGNREGGISWGCLTPPLLHRRSDMPCPRITSSS